MLISSVKLVFVIFVSLKGLFNPNAFFKPFMISFISFVHAFGVELPLTDFSTIVTVGHLLFVKFSKMSLHKIKEIRRKINNNSG